jgi:hypothetical protein
MAGRLSLTRHVLGRILDQPVDNTQPSIRVGSVGGISFMLLVHDEPFQFGDLGRRKAARSVGILWIDGLWPAFCRINWESVVVVTHRPSTAVPFVDGPAERCICAFALWKSSLASKAGSDRAKGLFDRKDFPRRDFVASW